MIKIKARLNSFQTAFTAFNQALINC